MKRSLLVNIFTPLALLFIMGVGALLAALPVGRASPAPTITMPQEGACIACHSTLSGAKGEPVELWLKSVHKEVGTTCDACHGGDPKDSASSWMAHKSSPEMAKKIGFLGKPSEASIPQFCGKCHMEIKDNYLESKHGAMGAPNCVTCHSSHSVQRASLQKIREEICTACHENPKADAIEALIVETRGKLEEMSGLVKQYRAYLTTKVEEELKKAEAEEATVGTVFHAFSGEKIKARISTVEEGIKRVASEIEGVKKEIKKRNKFGAGIIVFALVMAALLYYYRKLLPIPGK